MKKVNKLLFVLIPIFLFIAIWALGELRFYGNDEILIMDVLSGRMTGEPYACTSYFHIFLGFIISRLYKIAYLPWFPAFIIICTLLGETCIYDAIYGVIKNTRINIFIKVALLIANLFLSAFLFSQLSFTVASTLVGVASIYLLQKGKRKMSIAMLLLSTAIRTESGFVACVFFVAMMLIKAQEESRINNIFKLIKAVFWRVVIVVLAVVMVSMTDEIIKYQIEPQGYREFRKAQAKNFDIIKNEDFNKKSDSLMQSIGWDDTLYKLSKYKYFSMDERINATNLNLINQYAVGLKNFKIKNTWNYLRSIMNAQGILLMLLITYTLSIYNIYVIIKQKDQRLLLYVLIYIFMSALFLYLCILQRLISRSVLSIALPAMEITLFSIKNSKIKLSTNETLYFDIVAFALSLLLFITGRFLILTLLVLAFSFFRFKNKYIMSAVTIMLVISLSVLCVTAGKAQYRFAKFVNEISVNKEKIESYAQKHRENIYIYGADFFLDNRINTTSTSTYNVLAYGGTQVHSRVHEIQMEKAGLKYYNTRALYENNVYFVDLVSNPADVRLMNELLKSKGKDDVLQLYDRIDNSDIGIYKLQN